MYYNHYEIEIITNYKKKEFDKLIKDIRVRGSRKNNSGSLKSNLLNCFKKEDSSGR